MSESILEYRNVDKYFDELQVLEDVSLSVTEGDVVVIIGPSGSGKSTLLRCANRLEEIERGEITIEGTPIHDETININTLRQQIGMVFQEFNLFPHLTVEENITLAPRKIGDCPRSEAKVQAEQLLEKMGLPEQIDKRPNGLSGGQKQRVAIARALAMDPAVMLFDEVTSALDPELVGDVLTVIEDLAEQGMTMVLVTHEMNFARTVADRIVFMDHGRVVEEQPTEAFFESPKTDRAEQFLSRLL